MPHRLLVHHCFQAAKQGDRYTLRALWAPELVRNIKGAEIRDVMVSDELASMLCHAYAEIVERVLATDFLVVAEIIHRKLQTLTSIPIDPDQVAEFWRD